MKSNVGESPNATPTVLLVDDEPGMRFTLAANLELEGYTVIEAESAEHALEIAGSQDFDLVLSDIRMPGMSGVELFRRLRALGKNVPVVLMTAFADEELIAGALEDGAFTVLSKPFNVEHAILTLANAVRRPIVLVVDDVENVAVSTAAALEAVGIHSRALTSGREALEAVATGVSDLVVLDLVMPELAGPEVAAKARAIDPRLAIIAVSGEEVPEMLRQIARIGMHTFLRKPFVIRDLVRSIALARGQRERANPGGPGA